MIFHKNETNFFNNFEFVSKNKAQDKLKTFKGVFNYDPADEKQVYLSFPNFAEEI